MRIALVGCGHMADIHIPYILKTKGVQLVALCDQNELRGRELAWQHNVLHHTDVTRMLAETQPDVVHVFTPSQAHAALTVQALEAGCHVLAEKQLYLIREEADAIFDTAHAARRLVGVDHPLLWSPLVQRARRVVESFKG